MHTGFWLYILASERNGTLYVGVTRNLPGRTYQHELGKGSEFTAKYKVFILVYAEHHQYWENAFKREKQLKAWKREWKIRLIEESNPEWQPINLNL